MLRFGIAALAFILAGALAVPAQAQGRMMLATPGGVRLELEVVTRPKDRFRGLSGRESLPPGRGMAFVYRRPDHRCMVMRDMRFGLDIIWLRGGVVLGVSLRIPPPGPGDKPRESCSPQPVDMVIEVPAGWAAEHDIKAGSRLD